MAKEQALPNAIENHFKRNPDKVLNVGDIAFRPHGRGIAVGLTNPVTEAASQGGAQSSNQSTLNAPRSGEESQDDGDDISNTVA